MSRHSIRERCLIKDFMRELTFDFVSIGNPLKRGKLVKVLLTNFLNNRQRDSYKIIS